MLRHPVYTRTRIAQVGERIAAHIYPEWCDPDSLMVSGPVDRISLEEAEQLAYRDAKLGEQFGPLWTTFWFRIEATVPPEWAGHRVDLLWVTHSRRRCGSAAARSRGSTPATRDLVPMRC